MLMTETHTYRNIANQEVRGIIINQYHCFAVAKLSSLSSQPSELGDWTEPSWTEPGRNWTEPNRVEQIDKQTNKQTLETTLVSKSKVGSDALRERERERWGK